MVISEQCEKFSSRYNKLNDSGKQYIEAILQSLEFAQDAISEKNISSQNLTTQLSETHLA